MKTKLHLSLFSTNKVSRTFFHSALMTAVVLLLAMVGAKLLAPFSSSAKQNSQATRRQGIAQSGRGAASCPTCSPAKQRMIYAPLIDLPESSGSEIVLNSRSGHDMVITPTFYTLEGEAYTGNDITLKPTEIRFVDTKSLIPAKERNRHKWGGMSFSYVGGFMEAWAQLTLHGIRGGGSVNVVFTVMSQKRSNTAEAVWWTPRGGSAVIALGNSSDQPVRANLTFTSGASQFVDVGPFATEIVRLNSNILGPAAAGRVESVSINYAGPEGSLIPAGYTSSAEGKFASMIRFYDTQRTVQQHLYATNLQIKNAKPHMALRNVSTDFVTATPTFLPPNGDPNQAVKLTPIKLAPSDIVEVDLDPLLQAASNRSDLDSVSVQVSNTGNAGSLIGALYSLNTQTGVTYDVPLRDSGPLRASTGAYPVRLDGDYTTVVTISNTTNEPGDFTMQINYDGGHYVTGIIHVAAGGAKTYDIRKLRDEQKPDINGRPLPGDLKIAQVKWSVRGKVRLNGRTEMVSVRDRVSSSYSCFTCCPDSTGGFITPFNAFVSPGATFGFIAMEQPYNTGGQSCGGPREPYPIFANSWESDTESVATVDSSGLATGISGGFASISCYWTGYVYVWDDLDESCDVFEEPVEPSAGMTVVSVTDVTASGATKITSVLGNESIIHFVTPKGASGDNVTLTASITPNDQQSIDQISWDGATQNPSNKLQATVSKGSASKKVVKVKVGNQTAKELRVWIVWATVSSPTEYAITYEEPAPIVTGKTGAFIKGGYGFLHTIAPAEIITDNDRPKLSEANTNDPPGDTSPLSGQPLSGGANKMWDNSRQVKSKVLKSGTIADGDFTQPPPVNVSAYPSDGVEGNDDTSVIDEINDPYANSGKLIGLDTPGVGIAHSAGANNDTFEWRLHFREFTRLEIGGTWYRISDYFPWRIHLKFKKVSGKWVNDGSNQAKDNNGF
jgi:hypothetical protein